LSQSSEEMDSLVRYTPLTPQKDESFDSIMSSYDDFRLDDGQEDKPELYEHIGAPVPLPKEKHSYNSDVRTAYRFNFSKLPDEMYNAPSSYEEMIHEKKVPLIQRTNINKTRMEKVRKTVRLLRHFLSYIQETMRD